MTPERTRRTWLGVAALAALAGAGTAWWRMRPGPMADDAVQALWSQGFDTPQGGALRLADLRGQRLVLNFWATWCPPCVEELPMLDAFHRAQQARGWRVVGLAVDSLAPVQRFLQARPLSFPVGLAGTQGVELSRALGNVSGGLPFSVVFDTSGAVVQRKLGKLTPDDLKAWELL